MSDAKKVQRKVDIILGSLNALKQVIQMKDPGFNMKKIDKAMGKLDNELQSQSHAILEDAKKPREPRSPEEILKEIAVSEKVDKDLMEEIRQTVGN